MKFEITDEHGTVIACELFEDRIRIITDADRLPQGHPVWLTGTQVVELILGLTELWVDMKGADDASPADPSRP